MSKSAVEMDFIIGIGLLVLSIGISIQLKSVFPIIAGFICYIVMMLSSKISKRYGK